MKTNQETKKIACLFPGIGYTCDKPLLYYSWKLLKGLGWEIVPVPYSGFPEKVKGDPEKMRQCARMALEQAETLLRTVDWGGYGEILFVGKSVGTVVCAAYAKRHGIRCRQVLFTPVEETFEFAGKDALVFHGTADPWADTKGIRKRCRELGLNPPREIFAVNDVFLPHGSHSLLMRDAGLNPETLRTRILRTLGKEPANG